MASEIDSSVLCGVCYSPVEYAYGSSADERKAGRCQECGTFHHVSCWKLNGGCSRYACSLNPQTRGHAPIPGEPFDLQDLSTAEEELRKALREIRVALKEGYERSIIKTWEKHRKLFEGQKLDKDTEMRIYLARERNKILDALTLIRERNDPVEVYTFVAQHSTLEKREEYRLESIKDYREDGEKRVRTIVERIDEQLENLHRALAANDDANVAKLYDATLEKIVKVLNLLEKAELKVIKRSQDRMKALVAFEAAHASNSHRRIAETWNEKLFQDFKLAEKYRDEYLEAEACVQASKRLVIAYEGKDWQTVLAIYASHQVHFSQCADFAADYQNKVVDARQQLAVVYAEQLKQAIHRNDDIQIEAVTNKANAVLKIVTLMQVLETMNAFTETERKRAELALTRMPVVREIQALLPRRESQTRALALYDANVVPLQLSESNALTALDRVALFEARQNQKRRALKTALKNEDEDNIIVVAAAANAVGSTLSPAIQERVQLAHARRAARTRVQDAKTDVELLIAYDQEILEDDPKFANEKRQAVATARSLFKPMVALKRALQRKDRRKIAALTENGTDVALIAQLDDWEKTAVSEARAALESLEELRDALAISPSTKETLERVVRLYSAPGVARALESLLTPNEKLQIRWTLAAKDVLDELEKLGAAEPSAQQQLKIAQLYRAARRAGDVIPRILDWTILRAALEFEEHWTALTSALELQDEGAIFDAWDSCYRLQALTLLTESQKQILQQALRRVGRREYLFRAQNSGDAERIAFAQSEILVDSTPTTIV